VERREGGGGGGNISRQPTNCCQILPLTPGVIVAVVEYNMEEGPGVRTKGRKRIATENKVDRFGKSVTNSKGAKRIEVVP